MNWLSQRLASFAHAFRGIGVLLREPHARLHLLATILVLALAWVLDVTRHDWQLLLLTVVVVWLAEGMNTALELACDAAVPEQHPLIGKAKDVAAGTVLITAIFALVMGALIFIPYL